MADKADIRQGIELGADDYLTKPFTRNELLGAIATRFAKQETILQQYAAEHQRAEALQQKVKELQQYADAQDKLLQQFEHNLRNTLPKLNIAIHMMKNLESKAQRDRCLAVMQAVCAEEITLLNQMPSIKEFFTPEDITLLHQFNLVRGET
jgi:response regulator RpfG family c-di-GMP phosphodiesterase